MNINELLPVMQLLLTCGNLGVMVYAFRKFLSKPRENILERLAELEFKQKETEQALRQGNDRFKEHSDAISVMQRSLLALIEFEIQYCISTGTPITKELEKARDDLHDYLGHK